MKYHKMKSSTVTMKLNLLDEANRKRAEGIYVEPWQLQSFLRTNKFIQEASRTGTLYLCKKYTGELEDHVKAMQVQPEDIIAAGQLKELTQKEAVFEFKLVDSTQAEALSRQTLSLDRMLYFLNIDLRHVFRIEFATLIAIPKY